MSRIEAIGTALPAYQHRQDDILSFMQQVFALDEEGRRKLRFMYRQGGIEQRYSVIPDYSQPARNWQFYPATENLEPFPSLEHRMNWYNRHAASLSVEAIKNCLAEKEPAKNITHLISVSCTGMSAPGLDLQVMELLSLPNHIYRSSVNFMGCYAAIHALKMADAICRSEKNAKVMIVCTELCTLHFQRQPTMDAIASSLLFSDGSAAALVSNDGEGLFLDGFYSEVISKGKKDMCWELGSSGFLMTLSGFIPDLIEEDFEGFVSRALHKNGSSREKISRWCLHPGGKKILETIQRSLQLPNESLAEAWQVLRQYGNMSSPTILFVLKEIMTQFKPGKEEQLLGAAFGPGLTMESFLCSYRNS